MKLHTLVAEKITDTLVYVISPHIRLEFSSCVAARMLLPGLPVILKQDTPIPPSHGALHSQRGSLQISRQSQFRRGLHLSQQSSTHPGQFFHGAPTVDVAEVIISRCSPFPRHPPLSQLPSLTAVFILRAVINFCVRALILAAISNTAVTILPPSTIHHSGLQFPEP